MKTLLCLVSLVFNLSYLQAQIHWGKADVADFSIKRCPFDTAADAIILLDSAYITIEKGAPLNQYNISNISASSVIDAMPHAVYVCYKRLLILNKTGVSHSNISIPVVTMMNLEVITKLEAQTLNLNDKGKIEISKVKDNAFFYDTIIKGFGSNVKFTFPSVKDGSILEYKYTLSTANTELKDWLFQTDLPVLRSALSIKIPDFEYCDIRFQGNLPFVQDKIEHYKDVFNENTGIKTHFVMENIPVVHPEPFVENPPDLVNKIRFYKQNTRTINGISTHNGWGTWNECAKSLAKRSNYFTPGNNVAWTFLARQIVNNLTGKSEKVKAIYDNVHEVMKWNKRFSTSPSPFTQAKGINDSIGNSADINLILLGMLRSAGITAYPVLLSTNDHGQIDTAYVNPKQFNHLIVSAELDSTDLLLDAINPYCPWYLLPEKDLDCLGLKIIDTKGESYDHLKTEWLKIETKGRSHTSVSSIIDIDSMGNYAAQSVFNASDYLALQYRDRPAGKTIAEMAKNLLKISDDIDIKNEKIENENDPDKKLKIVFDLNKKNTSSGDSFLYISPFPIRFYSDNPFQQNQRTHPIDFGYAIQRNLRASINLPKTYKIVELPQKMNILFKDSSASFTLDVLQTEWNIQLSASFNINNTYYSLDGFAGLKALYAKMIDACNSVIVLQKL